MAITPERLKIQRTLDIMRSYFEEYKSIGTIAKQFGISRSAVFSEINQSQASLRLQMQAQIASVIQESVLALAATAEQIRLDAESLGNMDLSELARRSSTLSMYGTLFDRVMPIMQEYMARNPLERPGLKQTPAPAPQRTLGVGLAPTPIPEYGVFNGDTTDQSTGSRTDEGDQG